MAYKYNSYIQTGQEILFRGLDKAEKSKSIKCSKGYFKYLWFEELDEFNGMEEIRKVEQSVMRGGSKFVVFRYYNPPKSIGAFQEMKYNDSDKRKSKKREYRTIYKIKEKSYSDTYKSEIINTYFNF